MSHLEKYITVCMYVCCFMHFRQLEETFYKCRRTASRFVGLRNPTAEVLMYRKVVCFLTCLAAYSGAQINQCVRHSGV